MLFFDVVRVENFTEIEYELTSLFWWAIGVENDLESWLFFAELKFFGVEQNSGLVAETLLEGDFVVRREEFDGVLGLDAVLAASPEDFDFEGETGSDVEFFEFELEGVLVAGLLWEHAGGRVGHGWVMGRKVLIDCEVRWVKSSLGVRI